MKITINLLLAVLICLGLNLTLRAQSTLSAGLNFQAYPTGFIPGISGELLLGDKNAIDFRAGVNVVRHGDAGKNDDERGWGLGLSHGFKRYLESNREKWYFGARIDLWVNTIDWQDDIGTPEIASGVTEVTVLQPTALLGYKWEFNERFVLISEAAFGAEINVNTEGREVGEGLILLLGVTGHIYL